MIHEQTYDDKGYHLSHDKQDFSTLTMNEDMVRYHIFKKNYFLAKVKIRIRKNYKVSISLVR